jgi:hypothetical protein
MMAELSQDLELEPTESMPNGLPRSTVLQFTPKSQIAVETVGMHPAARNPRYSISTLAYFATADPRVFGESGPPQIGEFIVGRLNSIDISLQIRSDMRLFVTLREYTFDKKSEKYSLYSAPADFQKAYKEALDRRKGGG